ncbi:hypothetical protein Y886_14115 [Xanthomonas hyacinthi DSM 19077]|nr:hypothetical protein Y886_14115 [Xanthomonas hyacinthi DSM 19077]
MLWSAGPRTSICEFQGTWYLFYHDAMLSGGVTHMRSIKRTELQHDAQGRIALVHPYGEQHGDAYLGGAPAANAACAGNDAASASAPRTGCRQSHRSDMDSSPCTVTAAPSPVYARASWKT